MEKAGKVEAREGEREGVKEGGTEGGSRGGRKTRTSGMTLPTRILPRP
jgi:hypothetical protein